MKKIIAIFAVFVVCVSFAYSGGPPGKSASGTATVKTFINPVDITVYSENANIYLGMFPQGKNNGQPYVRTYPFAGDAYSSEVFSEKPFAMFQFHGGNGWDVELNFTTTLSSGAGLTMTAQGTVMDYDGIHTPVAIHTGLNTIPGKTQIDGYFYFLLEVNTATMSPSASWGIDGTHEITLSGSLSYN